MAVPAHPNNTPGDFYVQDGCCTLCGVPYHLAPTLFSEDGSHCWVSRQPATADEHGLMLKVFAVQELNCIHYRGEDSGIQKALVELGNGYECDHLAERGAPIDLEAVMASEPHGLVARLRAWWTRR